MELKETEREHPIDCSEWGFGDIDVGVDLDEIMSTIRDNIRKSLASIVAEAIEGTLENCPPSVRLCWDTYKSQDSARALDVQICLPFGRYEDTESPQYQFSLRDLHDDAIDSWCTRDEPLGLQLSQGDKNHWGQYAEALRQEAERIRQMVEGAVLCDDDGFHIEEDAK